MTGAATVDKALDLLFHLHDVRRPLGPSEIARGLGLPKSSCHRLLGSLLARELVERDAAGHYRPGLGLLVLGLGAQEREPVIRVARPILEAEATGFGETVFLVGRRQGRLRVLDKSEGTGFLRAAPAIGDIVPSDVTAAGQLYRAYDADPALDPRRPGAPMAEEPAGAEERARGRAIRRLGYATNRDAWIEGLSVLAVPIWHATFAGRRELTAVLALGAASRRFDALGEARIAERLRDAAAEIESRSRAGVDAGRGSGFESESESESGSESGSERRAASAPQGAEPG